MRGGWGPPIPVVTHFFVDSLPTPVRRFLLLALLLFASAAALRAQPSDSTRGGVDWLVLPYAAYAPETKIEGGLVAGAYFRTAPDALPSQLRALVAYTQRRQIIVQLQPDVYLPSGWRVGGEVFASRYPDSFYGIGGDTPDDAEETYTDRFVRTHAFVQTLARRNLRVGPQALVRVGEVTEIDPACADASTGGRPDRLACGGVPGIGQTVVAGIGAVIRWDARDSLYDPTNGPFAEASILWHSAAWGSDFTFAEGTFDVRGYRRWGRGAVAAQVYAAAVAGRAPFQRLPQLGGADRMRGFREGRYRDDVYWTMQVAYRVPLFWRFKAVAFASAGEVGPRLGGALVDDVETAAGVGGRLRLTDDGVHGRIDLAMGDDGVELYIGLGEAF